MLHKKIKGMLRKTTWKVFCIPEFYFQFKFLKAVTFLNVV